MIEAYFDEMIEECSEVIKAICKARRFGLHDSHPDYEDGQENYIVILKELGDVLGVMEKLIRPGPEQDIIEQAKLAKIEKLKIYGPHGTYRKGER